jgi:prolyl oligopeptidase
MKVPKAAAMFVLSLPVLLAATGDAPPPARRAPVEDRYHGVAVVDDYRWLEDARSPEVVA